MVGIALTQIGEDLDADFCGLQWTVNGYTLTLADLILLTKTDIAAPGDMVICLGAGDITKWAAGLADGIAAAREAKAA